MTDHAPTPPSKMDLTRKILDLIRKEGMIHETDRVLIGFSGGVDSATLLFILTEIRREIPFDLAAAHVNHLLRQEESERDEAFTRQTAGNYGIPYFLERADVRGYAKSRGLSLQHAGRDIRYRFFNETADREGYTKIAIAHNLDDQVETFLLRLAKGTGIRGLSSIPPARDRIIRPFLNTYRSEIAACAESRSIAYVSDSSNAKTVYERNYIRHRVLPLLDELNPAFKEKVVSLLGDLTGINSFFDERKRAFLAKHVRESGGDVLVPVGPLKQLDEETRFRAISDIIASLSPSFVPLREHIRLIEKVLESQKPNLRLDLATPLRMKKTYDRLIFTARGLSSPAADSYPLQEGKNCIAPLGATIAVRVLRKPPSSYPKSAFTAYFDLGKIGGLSVRTFRNGDRFHPLGMGQPVKIKDFFISRKIPLEERRTIPLLVSGDTIIWVVGHRIDDRYKVDENTTKVLRVTVKKSCQPSSIYD